MNHKVYKNLRKWISLFIAIGLYYVVHEGSHAIVAIMYGVFNRIQILGLGVQVVVITELLTNYQLAFFCVIGSVSTLIVGYILVFFTKRIANSNSKYYKAILFYSTFCLLLIDPLYLSIVYRFVGGGDMNGILLYGISEFMVQLVAIIILVTNVCIFLKSVYPLYKISFENS